MNEREELMALRRLAELEDKQRRFSAPVDAPKTDAKLPKQSWGDVGGQAAVNFFPSLIQAGKDIGGAIISPIDTTQSILDLANSGLQKVLPEPVNEFMHKVSPRTQQNAPLVDALKQHMGQRYGNIENLKNTIATDPAGAMLDASTVLGGVGGALSKAPKLAKTGETVLKIAKAIDPVTGAAKAIGSATKAAGKGASHVLGISTGAGAVPIQEAAAAGIKGGSKADDFLVNMRTGESIADDVVIDAKNAVKNMKKARGEAYKNQIESLKNIPGEVNMTPIQRAVTNAQKIAVDDGFVVSKDGAKIAKDIYNKVDQFNKRPASKKTVYNLDKLKQAVGDIRNGTKPDTKARAIADSVYSSISDHINNISPEYKSIMDAYSSETNKIKELERTFSLKEGSTVDTALRKLQSVTRNNVNTNYGKRYGLAKELEGAGANNLVSKVSGQALSSLQPRGLGGMLAGGTIGYGIGAQNPIALPLLAAQSPRVIGESAYFAGKGAGAASRAYNLPIDLLRQKGISPELVNALLYQAGNVNETTAQSR